MFIYLIALILILTCSILGYIFNKNIFLKIIFIILGLISGVRYEVGVDYNNYISLFNNEEGYITREFGFDKFIILIKNIGGDYQMLFMITSMLMTYFVYKSILELDHNKWMSSLVYFCVSTFYLASFNGIRQYLAVAIFYCLLRYVKDRKLYYYFTCLLVTAVTFHVSVIFLLPMYFLLNKKLSISHKFLILIATVFVINFLGLIILYSPYAFYLTSNAIVEHTHVLVYIFFIISFIVGMFWNKLKIQKYGTILENLNYLCFLSLFLVIMPGSDVISRMLLRMNTYFLFAYVFIIPYVLNSIIDIKFRALSIYIVVILLVTLLMKSIIIDGEVYKLVPYHSNFNLFI